MSEDQESWRSPQFRQQIRSKIDEIIRQSGSPTTKSVAELENHVYGKAKSREEYMQFTARLIHFLRESNAKKNHAGMQQGIIGQPVPSSAPDPISSLQNLTSSQNAGEMQSGVGMAVPVSNLQEGSVMNVQSVSTLPVTISMTGVSPMSQMTMNQVPQQVVQRVNMPQNRMIGNQMMIPTAVANTQMANQHPAQRAQMMPNNIQMIQRMRPPTNQPIQVHQPTTADTQFYQGQAMQTSSAHPQQFQSNMTQQFQGSPSMMMANQNAAAINAHHPQLNQMQGVPVTMAPSPSGYIPSPSQGLLTSPMSVGMVNQRAPLSVASAPSPSLNTPVMMQGQSPAMRSVNEDQAYLDKLKQLSKFIEPLRNMITKIDRDESTSNERKKDLHKINNLLEIISDTNRRCSMEVLLKCEQVLEKMEFTRKFRGEASGQVHSASTLSKVQDHNIGQPLLDAVLSNIKKPFFNHTLHRTFGPAFSALTNSTYKVSSPPQKRVKHEDSTDVPDVLQGEIARLDHRFKVQMDPLQHPGSEAINLICRLDDKDLPCVPPIAIRVPHGYPSQPPQCRPDDFNEYSASSFLIEIQKSFTSSISRLVFNYSVTTLLHRWEMSVRQACSRNDSREP